MEQQKIQNLKETDEYKKLKSKNKMLLIRHKYISHVYNSIAKYYPNDSFDNYSYQSNDNK